MTDKRTVVAVHAIKANRRCGDRAPRILELGAIWRCQYHVLTALPLGTNPGTHRIGGWLGPRTGVDILEN
jgi:hypothetical protein